MYGTENRQKMVLSDLGSNVYLSPLRREPISAQLRSDTVILDLENLQDLTEPVLVGKFLSVTVNISAP